MLRPPKLSCLLFVGEPVEPNISPVRSIVFRHVNLHCAIDVALASFFDETLCQGVGGKLSCELGVGVVVCVDADALDLCRNPKLFHVAAVERRPALFLADREPHLAAAVLGEERCRIRVEPTIGRDQSRIEDVEQFYTELRLLVSKGEVEEIRTDKVALRVKR